MATGGSVSTFSPAGASRQSILSFQRRLSSGRRSVQVLGPGMGPSLAVALGPGPGGLARGPRAGLAARRHAPRLLVDGEDVTPMPLHDGDDRPLVPMSTATESRQYGWDLLTGLGTLGPNMIHSAPSVTSGFLVTRDSSMGTSMGFYGGPSMMAAGIGDAAAPAASTLSVLSAAEEAAPSQFPLPRPTTLRGAPATTPVKFILSETNTFELFDRPSLSAAADSEEGAAVRLDNELLQSHRDTVHTFNDAEVQTAPVWLRTRETNLGRVRRKNVGTQAAHWDLYDTEHAASTGTLPLVVPARAKQQPDSRAERRTQQRRRRLLRRAVLDRISSQRSLSLSDADTRSVESKEDLVVDEQLRAVLQKPAFKRAALQVERLLAEAAFREQQVKYRGLPASDPLATDLRFEYRLQELWRLECEWASSRAVTCLAWNPDNPDLLAVGYGKYLQQDQATGLVCMWSAKNPLMPERLYRFGAPVSALSFGSSRPNLLAVALYNGGLTLLDVSATEKTVVADAGDASESGAPSPSWEPIWAVSWMSGQEFQQDDQVLVTAGQDGRVLRWRRAERGLQLQWTPMLRVAMAEGGEQGLPPMLGVASCPDRDVVGLRQFAAVLCMEPVPRDPLRYMVATEDGCVHTCSTNYMHQHVSIASAHAGPVYRLSFSPFCDKVFLTCGADWTVRLWAVGVKEPLVTLTGGMQAVEDASWSPRNSTIIASISGEEVCMWDLRRKTYLPASRTTWPWSTPLTRLIFSPTQDNIVVGDRDGRIVVFALEDMPFAPYYQTKVLVAALQRALVTKPTVLTALKKLGEPFN